MPAVGVVAGSESPLWHADYFNLKSVKAQQTHEEFFTSPVSYRDSDRKKNSNLQ